jgi:Arc/MetJ-type ribon-helix-helix transcriptional regulator
MHGAFMAHTLTNPQKRLISELLKVGRWNNESEIVRYGLHLVAKEVETDHERSLEPYSAGVLARAYRRMTRLERKEQRALERASAGPQRGELE